MSSTPDGLNCSNCGRFVKFQACKSNKNGNRGVFFATCHASNDKGEQCSFIRRASRSPTTSPTLPSQPACTGPGPVISLTPVTSKCPIPNCGQTRLADDCTRRTCRKHCVEKGGCTSKKHKGLMTTSPMTDLPLATPSMLPSSATISAPPLPPIPSPPSNRSLSPTVVDARADPRFATHLRPIFTEIIAEQQENARKQNMLDAERKDNAQKAKQRIAIYPWTTENAAPTVKIYQNFTWPYLTVTRSLLSTVGLLDAGERGDLRMYDETEILDWVAVDMGYVMEVWEGQRLFLKDAAIRNCVDFQKSLDTCPQRSMPHLHNHLPRERAYVREMLKTASPPISSQSICSPLPSTSSIANTPSPRATPDPTPSPLHPLPPSLGESSYAGGTGGQDDPIEFASEEILWPTDYYTIQIGNCMRECSSHTHRAHQRSSTRQAVFAKHFPGVRFVPSTFSNQRDLWNNASGPLKDEFMELGRCKQGLWSAFAKRARREQKARAKVEDVIEIH